MFKLAVFLASYKKECIIGPVFKLFEAILELLLPTMMVFIINNGVANHDASYVLKMGGIMLSMSILGFACSMVCQYYAARASQGVGTSLRNALYQHIASFSHAEIDKFGTASLINRITNDVNQLQLAVAMMIRLVVRAPFICIGAILMAMFLDFKLAMILVAAVPVFAFILYFIMTKSSVLYRLYQKNLDRLAIVLRENLSGVRVIRAFAKTRQEKERFCKSNNDLMVTAIHIGRISALLNPMTSFIMNAAIVIILWIGGMHINEGTLSKGEIIAFTNYITQILLALIVVSNLVVIFTKAAASANRVQDIFATNSSIVSNGQDPLSIQVSQPIIEFKDVSFKYNTTGDMALDHVSVQIESGQTIGIIGSTGSGKSTFINLIPRFYDVNQGEIFLGGINVKEYSLCALRNKIGIVPQQAVLFTGSIADNIRWGKQHASLDEIIEAAKIAQAHEFVEKLPDVYQTAVTRGGLNFSGGQKQRLTIARALVAKPQILILDDSSSALDFATDAALRAALRENGQDMTVFLVSQRASSIKHADKILVFEDGSLVGVGSHVDLMETCPTYQEICLSQLSSKEAVQ
ncbi:ATP-binding cassette, subfamily B [Propionispira arboris]|uniref:ATP-binding cassette, subfamily B n=1 Tax=Propionispira arboris TaxID=84035 RepID=A0A1H7BEG6_9FIRM|nr:ABC transporter ATP-binding protein [Propionispira arboris]SEJ75576.1 ATP-binding cassette, subfamily B [Propionispira arboris]